MPIIRIDLLSGRSPEIKQQLAAEMTASMARIDRLVQPCGRALRGIGQTQ